MGPRPRSRGCKVDQAAFVWVLKLQWGRGLAAADVPGSVVKLGADPQASMGPRPRSRGCLSGPARGRTVTQASMGPRPRSRGCLQIADHVADVDRGASMGPRPRSRGCARRLPPPDPTAALLQWGRGLAAADVAAWGDTLTWGGPRFNGAAASQPRMSATAWRVKARFHAASMGPRPRSRGCAQGALLLPQLGGASMGPRPRSRGCWGGVGEGAAGRTASMGPRPRSRGCSITGAC